MGLGCRLLILATFLQVANVDADDTDRYGPPPSKIYIKPCEREALLVYPGAIDKQRVLHLHGDYWVEYEIQARDGSEWLVLCDLSTGKIIREQELLDDAL
jgi:uncharacterized membrane protein YkoI